MQCPSCHNTNLSPSGDGRLVCDDCGEQFAGFQEEEVDFVLAGTTISTRQSQSSQAHKIRQRLLSEDIRKPIAKPSTPLDMLICEGTFHLAKAIVNRLIELSYVHPRIKVPLFEIITCWVRRRQEFADFSTLRAAFQPYHVLSLVCLAALYTRSPLLPRDLCRLVSTRQVPFLAALKTVFPPNFEKSEGIRFAFTPDRLPVARHVAGYANKFARGKGTWPPLRRFFRGNGDCVTEFHFVFDPLEETLASAKNITSFPLGHPHITLLRITRLLGLPDAFGARVLRFIELRRTAVKMARMFGRETDGPWDDSGIDEYSADHIPSYENGKKVFSKPLPGNGDLYGFATDESLQADIINTMRLCYGKERSSGTRDEADDHDLCLRLKDEWEACKEAMMRWLRYGNPEDIDNITWTSFSPNVLAGMHGKELREYTRLVDDILSERGEQQPEMWGRFVNAFENIGRHSQGTGMDEAAYADEEKEGYDHLRKEKTCIYDIHRCGDEPTFDIPEGKAEMERQAVAWRCDKRHCGTLRDSGPNPLREYGSYELSLETAPTEKKRRRKTPRERDYLVEPAGIGLAWTIVSKFFEGTNIAVDSTVATPANKSKMFRLRTACDRSMEIVVKYVLGLKLRSTAQGAPPLGT